MSMKDKKEIADLKEKLVVTEGERDELQKKWQDLALGDGKENILAPEDEYEAPSVKASKYQLVYSTIAITSLIWIFIVALAINLSK